MKKTGDVLFAPIILSGANNNLQVSAEIIYKKIPGFIIAGIPLK
jgi:hypothetical protein